MTAGDSPVAILWRRLDVPGHDAAWLHATADGWQLDGTAVYLDVSGPCRLDYRVSCDPRWRTTAARVTGWRDGRAVDLAIAVDAHRRWSLDGHEVAAVAGCDDVDLSFTPATNLLPIRRLGLAVGERAPVRAAWLRWPDVALEPLDQVYARQTPDRYHYQSGGAFTALLDVRADGFVVRYPGLWVAESQPADV